MMNVIAVDDEKLALNALCRAVTQADPDVSLHAFSDAKSAIAYVSENDCDVAFLDIQLHTTSGLQLSSALKQICPNINIIFVSGYDDYAIHALKQRCSGYLLKPVTVKEIQEEFKNLRFPVAQKRERIHAHTFGNFELFVEERPVKFLSKRSKELLAYLIDRNGAAISNAQIASVIWENNMNTISTQTQLRKAKASLQQTLKEAGISEILISSRNDMAVDKTKMSCDYWQLLDNDARAISRFNGEYMSEYSWAEVTNGLLMKQKYK